jgi:hypothetical protein
LSACSADKLAAAISFLSLWWDHTLVFVAGVEPQAQIVVRTAQAMQSDNDLAQEFLDLTLVVTATKLRRGEAFF